jgi:7,8-dihydro-6-hydroxymethylpterin-pyrophosphokinase
MKNPTRLHYIYYRCTKRKDRNCTQKPIRSEKLEAQIDWELRTLELDDDYLKEAIDYLNKKRGVAIQNKTVTVNSLQKAYNDVEQRLDRLEMEYTSSQNRDYSLFTPERFGELKAKLLQERRNIEKQMKRQQTQEDQSREVSIDTFNFCAYARAHLGRDDKKTKREILLGLGSNLTLTDGKLSIQAYKPYLRIKKTLAALKEQNARFEPGQSRMVKREKAVSGARSPEWQGLVEAVRTWIGENLETFRVPKLTRPG